MEQAVPSRLIPAIRDVVHQLVLGKYALLIADGRAPEWTEATLRDVIREVIQMGGALVELPNEDLGDIALPVDGGGWGIDLRLRTTEGPSPYRITLDFDDDEGIAPVHIGEIRIH